MDAAAARARLAELDRELARLREQFELAMSAFRFEDTKPVHDRIAAAERERERLAALAPPPAEAPPEPVIIGLGHLRRRRRR